VDALIVETTRGEQARAPGYSRPTEEDAFAEADRAGHRTQGFGAHPGVRHGQDPGNARDDPPLQNRKTHPQAHAGLHRRLSTKMTHITTASARCPAAICRVSVSSRTWKSKAATAKAQGADSLRLRLHLCAFQRHDVRETVSNVFARQGILENKRTGCFSSDTPTPRHPAGGSAWQNRATACCSTPHPPVPLNCEMRIFDFSGHSTRDAIADYIVKVRPKKSSSCTATMARSSGSARRSTGACRIRR
jgi:hypothetical protein